MDTSQIDNGLQQRPIYSVSQLNQEVKQLLQQNFPLLWIEGELSNVARPASGHIYFSLKDEFAQIRCAMFRNANRQLPFRTEDGMHVQVRARVGIYEPRGEYQLTVEYMEEAGVGVLQRKFEELKRKLNAEELFESAHKQPIPVLPKSLGIISSASGAAVHDILSILQRRFPLLAVHIYAVPVQGEASANAIVDALQAIHQQDNCDVIILARGGGSIEDLWSFNEEIVARAIFAAKIPIVTGIGHEIDITIADFVADLRAATPSAAAELIVPHQDELFASLAQLKKSLLYFIQSYMGTLHQTTDWASQRLVFLHPKATIQRNKQQLAEMKRCAVSAVALNLYHKSNQLDQQLIRFENQSPKSHVDEAKNKLRNLRAHLGRLIRRQLDRRCHELETLARTLDVVSPQDTLNRGYAIVTRAEDGKIVDNADQVSVYDKILIQLAKGRLGAHIDKK